MIGDAHDLALYDIVILTDACRMLWRGAVYLDTIARDVGTRTFRGLVLGGLNATMFGPSMGMRQPDGVQSWIN